jgi:histidine triad (HIT) family protein
MDCLFCNIANHTIDSNIIYEDDELVAFDDIRPQAPQHTLIIPKRHIATLNDLQADDTQLVGRMVMTAKQLAQDLGVAEQGYRLVFNCNRYGGQEVYHLHLHFLAGRQMQWPPG